MTYRSEIDGLRAVAVLSVVIFHFFPMWLSHGFLGVDVFFVISGFLIATQLLNSKFGTVAETLKWFYQRRIRRLFPALFLFLTVTYLFLSWFFISVDLQRFEASLFSAFTFWANFYFWRDGGYFGGPDQLKPLLHIWSLSVEEQFYIFAPVSFLIFLKLSAMYGFVLICGVSVLVIVSFGLWSYLNSIGGENPAFFLLPTRVWQFGLGAMVAITFPTFNTIKTGSLLQKVGFVFAVTLILLSIILNYHSEIQTLVITLGAVAFLVFSYNNNSIMCFPFKNVVSTFFGKISYSLYLYHWPIAVALTYFFVDDIPILYSLLGILLSVLLAWSSFVWVENAFRYSRYFRQTIVFLIVCVITCCVVFLVVPKNEESSLSNLLSKASGTNFRCDIASYRPYGSSRACVLTNSQSAKEQWL